MRVLVTGATGFVGRWLIAELEAGGHEVLASGGSTRSGERRPVEVTDRSAVTAEIGRHRPDAVAHLAAVSFGPDAASDPGRALAINVGGTINVVGALGALGGARALLVTGSSEVYGAPDPHDLPLDEASAIAPRGTYGLTKVAQEAIALAHGRAMGLRVVATRSFNHAGPGQRTDFAIPAFASRIVAARQAGERSIRVGNIDVRRDITDVRDVVRAYRRLLELAAGGGTPADGLVVNVASGTSVAMRDVLAGLSAVAGFEVEPAIDPGLVRSDDPPDIRGDATRLRALTGWRPEIPLERTLADVMEDLAGRA
jgi:GDP-4-dehydro-6-deoxy-D-mannose reductase